MCRPLYTFAKAAAHLTGTLPNLARLLARQAAREHLNANALHPTNSRDQARVPDTARNHDE